MEKPTSFADAVAGKRNPGAEKAEKLRLQKIEEGKKIFHITSAPRRKHTNVMPTNGAMLDKLREVQAVCHAIGQCLPLKLHGLLSQLFSRRLLSKTGQESSDGSDQQRLTETQ
ncbi:hypothetical protein G7Y89_g7947 [Cudoniella acicularis]|uniref:Uncharacterized protein n=1 Tax=Cudoniella acicularis TaxID=354080 RepID=A0A8H4W421_9HELO|nr:hypothetical protein G7Y89_g7947 [Cudoniella acicularis]